MKNKFFSFYFILSYTGTIFSLLCLIAGRLMIFRFLLFLFCVALLGFMSDRNGRGGFYRIPGYVLFCFGLFLLINGPIMIFSGSAIGRGLLFILYGFPAAAYGLITANRL